MEISPGNLDWREAYKLLVGSILPRPIAFVTTIDDKGIVNAAPFSFFTAICADPLLICFSPMRRGTDGAKKDTLTNIETTKDFVINIVSEDFVEKMNMCATEFPSEIDEMEVAGLTKLKSHSVKPPRIGESKIHLECTLYEALHFGEQAGSGSLVIGKVEHVHVADELYEKGRINSEKLKPIGRLAGQLYTKPLADMFELIRKINPG
ncbi:flavin reductase family protein [Bacillus sp. DTU_2020_1000418_1_SI_GHA_SEK_038]|uniref:flavin reductase family protein n=1 Tax=Bacillus sp. DTU_2020_1000418_1_SI_GHA_SEK_038 TaxID=3077585 RepID=UPI0028EE3D85|nr:flavin reductase family protein [Bacillus sp. DTU_2020_1000418_1_SI_GHA_SEK_038]WNS77315.1 flavin reductase family protein [Bacillus sp. DTU_2020_1000418_1_SI_GHA_SEK_038]